VVKHFTFLSNIKVLEIMFCSFGIRLQQANNLGGVLTFFYHFCVVAVESPCSKFQMFTRLVLQPSFLFEIALLV
jgi:hypothetical protein